MQAAGQDDGSDAQLLLLNWAVLVDEPEPADSADWETFADYRTEAAIESSIDDALDRLFRDEPLL